MDLVYNCDDNYAVHTAVSITSLFENNIRERSIRVFILGNGISGDSKNKLESLGSIYTVIGRLELKKNGSEIPGDYLRSVKVIELEGFEERLKGYFGEGMDAGKFTVTALARIFAPGHLPLDVEKYIYLDCDTVVLKPLNALYNAELSGNAAGMVPEPTIYKEVRGYLGLGEGEPYFNTGMMLVDKKLWEAEDITGKCVSFYKEKNGRLPFSDQDIINHSLRGRVKVLWQGYDFFSNYHYRSYKSLISYAPWYSGCMSKGDYEAARRLPAIVHFAGDERPWYNGNHNPYRGEYEKYLELSPFKGTEKITGHEKEMRLYHIMNLVTSVCPFIRDRISEGYYRKNYRT